MGPAICGGSSGRGNHYGYSSCIRTCPGQSATWRRMLDAWLVAERHIRWIVGSGNSSFWHDNWLGSGLLCRQVEIFQEQPVADFVVQGGWNWVLDVDPPSSGQVLPLKVSFFMVRLMSGRIPVMGVLHKFGVVGPSRCFCCRDPSQETINHIFCIGDVARQVWSFFEVLVGGFGEAFTIRHKVISWWLKSGKCPYIKLLFRLLSSLICWNLWKARNKFVFKEKLLTMKQVCDRVFIEFRERFGVQFREIIIPCSSWPSFFDAVAGLGSVVNVVQVRWKCPVQAIVKLNSDGCLRGNPRRSGGGGLFRDSDGRVLLAFSCYFGEMTSLQAEVKALLHGVQLVIARGLANFHLESDSLVLIQLIQGRAKCPWVVQRELQELVQYSHLYIEISHCF
ncbi:uncharacterized protein LOC113769293 [Coffea eugenioides]|uniref:uncharacterized protein LOC113769293 n=1 Tax=Coffea eugenioides TaxID=49369 RepID=UPI000F5CAC4B|nr:uncharacterized protein LOC113741022 [Coffea arabica]XP_027169555.1 uncharacterized protein LOC113769293 [Coffea eugenioides]